jgi:hypothetical protein
LWYPWDYWVPYYYVPEEYVVAYTDYGTPIPPSAYVINTASFPEPMPPLPTFAAVGISMAPLLGFEGQSLTPSQQQAAQAVRNQIDAELAALRNQYADLEAQGYHVVPDMDRAQFSWVREA